MGTPKSAAIRNFRRLVLPFPARNELRDIEAKDGNRKMKSRMLVITGSVAALAMAATISFTGEARAQCYWTAQGYICPAPHYSVVAPDLDNQGRPHHQRSDQGYPGMPPMGSNY
jgi:hypothetical protein